MAKGKLTMTGPIPGMAMEASPKMMKEQQDRRTAEDAYYCLQNAQRLIALDGKDLKKNPKAMAILRKLRDELDALLGDEKETPISTMFQR